mmetsp:Transcript_29168/g.41276  ORF Transcript_29168/g.41276 Transcript_29168/m.41276 type:complete len:265 (+) Transcript_29168:739-1533(+)
MMMMAKTMVSMKISASGTATRPLAWLRSVWTRIHITTMKKRKENSLKSVNTSNAPKPSSRKTMTTIVVNWRKRKSNTSLAHTVLNKEVPSTLVFLLMMSALFSLIHTVELLHTRPFPTVKVFLTPHPRSLVRSASHARNQRRLMKTTMEMMNKMRTKSSRCAKKFTPLLESARVTLESTMLTPLHATTWKESRSCVRMELYRFNRPKPTRLHLSSLDSSLFPSFFWPPMSTSFTPSFNAHPSTSPSNLFGETNQVKTFVHVEDL